MVALKATLSDQSCVREQYSMSALAERLAALERTVATLAARLSALEEPAPSAVVQSGSLRGFKPVEPTPCPLKPCLVSSALERVAANCSAAIWAGRWSVDPLLHGNRLRGAAGWANQHFAPGAAHCEAADPFVLAPTRTEHVTVARSQFTTSRLRGLRDALWLMVGTSIDHGIVYEVCVRFGREGVRVADAAPSRTYPRPGLHFNWCTLPPPLNLTMVEVSAQGLTTLAHQRESSRHRQHLAEIQSLLNTIGWGAGPTFLTLGGIEWDLKQWAAQQAVPTSAADWAVVRDSLAMQAATARRFWPKLRAVTMRTQFRTTCAQHRRAGSELSAW